MAEGIAAAPDTSDPEFRARRRRAILSAWAGFAVDSYSIYIAGSVLLPALVYFQGDMSAEGKAIFAGMTLAVTLLGRPLGGLIFGHFADKIGRRTTGAITIYGFGIVSLLIALLPGAEQVGAVMSVTLLLLLRFIEGIFLGGEYTAATPMALEYAPPNRRGLIGALIQCSASAGPLFVAIAMALTLMIAPSGDVNSPYVQWGWRLPFVVGFVLSILVAWFLRRRVEDSEVQRVAKQEISGTVVAEQSPLRMLLRGRTGRAFIQAWVIMTGVFFVVNITGSVLQQFLMMNDGYTAEDLANTQLIVPVAMASYVFFGWLSDHIGRKKALFITAPLTAVVYPVAITLIGSNTIHDWGTLTLLAVACHIVTVAPLGVLPAYINERFATVVRSSGWGVAYGTAVIIPSFFSYYMVWLSAVVPYEYTAGILVVIGAALIFVATACGPETRGIDLRKAGEDAYREFLAETSAEDQSGSEPPTRGDAVEAR
ncbi:Predicted arabinose efflux permease, MFS family [Pseudonocardia thermophila]|uniref:Predicted arabinose efflux permease, MFS family n=1 Tax=Pseudonocardia thermophila TaxID=1848 RepID=A0A1M6T3U9_PSETH|nr:MFS transporter [Pseudonocardia thermophila]SHK51566.1 Predicted arabinose efflux permease, MFS family [Pseudonocardia thermophila]